MIFSLACCYAHRNFYAAFELLLPQKAHKHYGENF